MVKKYGLIGKTLSYSFSKIIHEFLLNRYQIAGTYDLIEVDSVSRALLEQYDGLNVTIPYKQDVIPLLDENNCPFPACNTIKNVDGKLIGFNTDIMGYDLLVEKLGVTNIKKVVILGAGATSKMLQYIYKDIEAVVVTRKEFAENPQILEQTTADLLINATSVGMNEYASLVPVAALKNYRGIIDLNYNPMNSKLAMDALTQNVPFIGGLWMLIEQAVKAFEIWNELEVAQTDREEIYLDVCFRIFDKIALIGMPLAGKTTIISKFAGIDLDDAIIAKHKKSPKELLEAGIFRTVETEMLAELTEQGVKLIALGGGAVLKDENIALLKDYLIVFLDEQLEVLETRWAPGIRPLLKTKADLATTYANRIDRYRRVANIAVTGKQLEELINAYFTY